MAMTDADFLQHIRTHYGDLLDPSRGDKDFEYFCTIGPGWQALVLEYCERMQACLREHDLVSQYFLRQIKEKFGELRIYKRAFEPSIGIDDEGRDIYRLVEPSPAAADAMAAIADDIAARGLITCEDCGDAGELRVLDGWYSTCCDWHFEAWKRRKADRERGEA